MRRAGASALKEAARLQRIKAEKKKRRRVIMAIIGSIAGAVLIIVIVIVNIAKNMPKGPATAATPTAPKYPALSDEEMRRINCYPEQDGTPTDAWNISYENCRYRGCEYWRSRNPYAPICYMSPSKIGYRKIDVRRNEDMLRTDYHLRRFAPNGVFVNTSFEIAMSFFEITNQMLRIRVVEKSRFPYVNGRTVPPFQPMYDLADEGYIRTRLGAGISFGEDGQPLLNYKVESVSDWPFSVRVMRAKEGNTYGLPLFSTELGGLIISEDFVQVTTILPRGSRVYGIGEHRHTKFRRGIIHGTWALFSRNQPPDWMLDSNLYGAHPFLLVVDPSGFAHGLLFYNAAPVEISASPYPSLTWRAIGGMPDIFIFTGPTPDSVITQYGQIISRPMIPPRWFLGLHVCFSGANNLRELASMKRNFDELGLPWSVMCLGPKAKETLMSPDIVNIAKPKKISATLSSKVLQDPGFYDLPTYHQYVGRSVPLLIQGRLAIAPSCLTTARSNRQPFSVSKKVNVKKFDSLI